MRGGTAEASRILTLLFLANLLNFFDRVMPAVVIEEIRADFGLSDAQIGLLASALTIVAALAGLPLGRLADRRPRRLIMGWGLTVWSVLTTATGMAGSFVTLLLIRLGVGIGEASYAPAANSLIADLYPPERRSRATARYMLGLPLGLLLAYFTVGAVAEAFDSWRAPFLLAGIPGLVLAALLFRIREPARGAMEPTAVVERPIDRPLRLVASVPTMWWLILAFLAYNVAAYTVGTFTVPLLRRDFGLSLTSAGVVTGLVVGLTGLIGLTVGGRLTDRASQRSVRRRVLFGGLCLALAGPLTAAGLTVGSVGPFVGIFGAGWLLGYVFYASCLPAVSDVIEPRLRATAIAMLLLLGYVLGGAGGPAVVGVLSDSFAVDAMRDEGARALTREHRGAGLRQAMLVVVPPSLLVAAAAMVLAGRTLERDRRRMFVRMGGAAEVPTA